MFLIRFILFKGLFYLGVILSPYLNSFVVALEIIFYDDKNFDLVQDKKVALRKYFMPRSCFKPNLNFPNPNLSIPYTYTYTILLFSR